VVPQIQVFLFSFPLTIGIGVMVFGFSISLYVGLLKEQMGGQLELQLSDLLLRMRNS
jgi:flagellar biosynthesis protein FliR